jgi:hypothetical protein
MSQSYDHSNATALPADDRRLDLSFWVCGTLEVRDGKIVLWRDYFDLATFAWQALTGPLLRPFRVLQRSQDA